MEGENLVERLKNACTHVVDGVSPCSVHQVANRCMTCQAADVIERYQTGDDGCICAGNWRAIVKESEPLIGKRFKDLNGKRWTFFGIVHGDDDYYYGMLSHDGDKVLMLSCVGSIESYGMQP